MTSYSTLRAGVFFNWYDQAITPDNFNTSIGAMAFHADRGSLRPVGVGDYNQFTTLYGNSDYKRSYGHDTARAFFRTGEAAIAVRSPGVGAKYATALLANNFSGPVGSLVRDGSSITGGGSADEDFSTINRSFKDIIFTGHVANGVSVTITINGVATTLISSGDHVAFMRTLAQMLGALDSVSSAVVVNRPASSSTSPNAVLPMTIRIASAQNETLTVSKTIVLNGGAAVNASIIDTEWLAVLVSENPGAWGGNIGAQAVRLNRGRNAKTQILFTDAFSALHSFSAVINNTTITVPANVNGSNAMMTAIAAAISGIDNLSATVTTASGANNNRAIIIDASDNKTDIVVASAVVLQNASETAAPTVSVKVLSSRFTPETDFSFNIYEYPDMRRIVGSYTATFQESVDATGGQTNFTSQVNTGPSKSRHIRVYVNPDAVDNDWKINGNTLLNKMSGDGFLSGGVNGDLSTSADIIAAWEKVADPVRYPIRILMNCGYATNDVRSYMTQLCETRRDCHAILDMAAQDQDQDNIGLTEVEARHAMNIDSSRASIYSPDIWIYDVDRRLERYSPPSGYVGAIYALTDRTRREWWSPAGLNRGHIPEARGLRVHYDDAAQSNLAEAQINPIINYKGTRIVVFGDWTMQYRPSPMQYIGTRRMCNSIEIIATNTVAYSLHEPNTKNTRDNVRRVSRLLLQEYLDGEGISRFDVRDLTTTRHLDNRQAYFRYLIVPVTSIHQIIIDGVLMRNSSSFSETIATANDNGSGTTTSYMAA